MPLPGRPGPERVVAWAEAARALVRRGHRARAGAFVDLIQAAGPLEELDPRTRSYVHALRAELADGDGDLGAYLEQVEKAVASAAEADDARRLCLEREALARAYLQVGRYAEAAATLRETLGLAERMALPRVAAVCRVNLGLALARQGRLDEALAVEEAALEWIGADTELRATAHAAMAEIAGRRGDRDAALEHARVAVAAAEAPVRALVLATLSRSELASGRAGAAVHAARQAMALLEAPGGAGDGEALVRLVHAEALHAAGEVAAARLAVAAARDRLLERAARISGPDVRRSFLESVSEHARTLARAREWGA